MRDAHLHLADERLFPEADRIMEQLRALGVSRLVVNGTGPEDWGRVADLARRFQRVVVLRGGRAVEDGAPDALDGDGSALRAAAGDE